MTEVIHCRRLEIDSLASSELHRLRLELAHDALGDERRIPILVARGRRPGPVFGITAAVHGDEVNGLPVIHRLLAKVDLAELKGTIVAVPIVNLPGFRMRTRSFDDGLDLNHIMPGRADGRPAEIWAHRFVEQVVSNLDFLIDLHTASVGRINSLYIRADLSEKVAARMARLMRPQIVLDDPPSDGTLRGAADELGIPAITIEIGNPQRFQQGLINSTVAGLRILLGELKMMPKRRRAEGPEPIYCSASTWLRTDDGGLLEVLPAIVTTVEAGEIVARQTDVFGRELRLYEAPNRGIVIGKSVDPVASTGDRILHLGTVKVTE